MHLIHAHVSENLLTKVDRLFTNRLSHIFVELLQNARRAGAMSVDVTTTPTAGGTRIVFFDNGRGIGDFASLLNLGNSEWDPETERVEDPAGMGFFALCSSGVEVASHDRKAAIRKEQFLGCEAVPVEEGQEPFVHGTQLTFVRPESPEQVKADLAHVTTFGPLDVVLNGEHLPRRDYLQDAVKVKVVNGVRIGVFNSGPVPMTAANFHGSVVSLNSSALRLSNVLLRETRFGVEAGSLETRFDIIDTSNLRLKLPDRTAIVEDHLYKALEREARVVMFEYLAEQPAHGASYELYTEAHQLGVDLREASAWLRPFYVHSAEGFDRFGDGSVARAIMDPARCAIVDLHSDTEEPEPFTFDAAFSYFHALPVVPVCEDKSFQGYSWYDALPVYRDFQLRINDTPAKAFGYDNALTVVASIRLSFSLGAGRQKDSAVKESFDWNLPFAGWNGDDDWGSDPALFITQDSPWAVAGNWWTAPFNLADAAAHVSFSPKDDWDADSRDTQQAEFERRISREFRLALGGMIAEVQHLLAATVSDYDLCIALKAAAIQEVRLFPDSQGKWRYELKAA